MNPGAGSRKRTAAATLLALVAALLVACAPLQNGRANQKSVFATYFAQGAQEAPEQASYPLRGDPGFSAGSLTGAARERYQEFLAALENPELRQHITELASSGDLYQYGRTVHRHIVTLLTVFRFTGDLAILDEVDRLAELMRAQLEDSSRPVEGVQERRRDGYLNWVYRNRSSDFHVGRDVHEMDEMLTHGLVAEIAWAFENNRDLQSPAGVPYGERADFWREYLQDHFEAKWRERRGVRAGTFPFLERAFMHPTMAFVKYHYYMSLLTGSDAYLKEAERLSETVLKDFREVSTDSGPALVWTHGVLSAGGDQDYLQPTTYAGYTMGDILDLHLEGFYPWSDERLPAGLANTLVAFVIDNGTADFARDIGGGESQAGIRATRSVGAERQRGLDFAARPFALFMEWDESGTLAEVAAEVYRDLPENRRYPHIPAGRLIVELLREPAGPQPGAG